MTAVRGWLADRRLMIDVLVAAVVTVLAVVDTASTSTERLAGERPAGALAYVIVIAASASLAWRRRAPIAVLAVVTVAVVVFWVAGYGALLSALGLPALYAVAAHEENRWRAWWAIGVACTVLMVTAGTTVLDRPAGFAYFTALSVAGFLIAAIGAGVVIRNRERIFVDTERRAAQAEADRLAEAERAVVRERSRIAREMHDVVSHSMSVVAVQAAAGREIVHTNPDKAAEVFARIETVSRESLTELRRMLGVLRDGTDVEASLTPQPRIADVAATVEESSALGVTTKLVVEGEQRPVAPGIELATYRIIQEALTNVRKHAGASASATVRISYGSNELVVEVIDNGRGAASAFAADGKGHGVIGMRERVEIYGGQFSSGPRRGGGYVVRATLPIVADSSAASRPVEVTP